MIHQTIETSYRQNSRKHKKQCLIRLFFLKQIKWYLEIHILNLQYTANNDDEENENDDDDAGDGDDIRVILIFMIRI